MENLYYIHESSDGRLCPTLKKILEDQGNNLSEPLDYFAILLHSLMIETNFEVMNHQSTWKKGQSYGFEYKIPNQMNPENHCSLRIHQIGPVISIIGNYHGNPKESFVWTKPKITEVINPNPVILDRKFFDLREISCDFKNKIALPLWSRMSNNAEFPHLLFLPDEILVEFAANLSDPSSIKNFIETCTRFRNITTNPLLWKRLLQKQFPKIYDENKVKEAPDWKSLYKEEVTKVIRQNELERRTSPNPGPFEPNPWSPFATPGPNPHPIPGPNPFQPQTPFGPGWPLRPPFPWWDFLDI